MSKISPYQTKQKKALLAYLESAQGKHVTVNDIHDHFRILGMNIGISTIYRQLERMVAEGLVNQYILDKTDAACFEYVGTQIHHSATACFHCKCEKCGKLIHLQCDELEQIHQHLLKEHGFNLNPFRTVFYGRCNQCKEPSPSDSF